jgi:cyclophilin family peptidyl-prolyl cis-trans isomerase
MHAFRLCAALALFLSGCGGGGGGSPSASNSGTPQAPSAAASLSAQPLPDNKVRLTLSGVDSQASRYCIRQDAQEPLASDPCFSGSDSNLLVQDKTLSPSNTQRASFTAWLLSGSTVSRHASVSTPGKTCSAAAYAALAALASTQSAVCMLTGTGADTYEAVLLLEPVKAPNTVANFLRYVNQGFYDQTVFHRFLKSGVNVVQGGSYAYAAGSYQTKASTLPAIALESTLSSTLSNTAGSIAMARTSDPDSATAGFFVNTSNNAASFDSSTSRNGYAVFGRFIYGVQSWTELLNSVSGTVEVINPAIPVQLYWAYQIQ